MYQLKERTIDFAFYTDQVFDLVSRQTMYYARNKKSQNGEDMTEYIGISEDEKDFVLTELQPVIDSLFTEFVKLTNSVKNSLYVNKEVPDPVEPTKKAMLSGFAINKNINQNGQILFNENRLTSIDNKCLDYISCSIILRWSKLNGMADEVVSRQNELTKIIKDLNSNLFYLKVPIYGKVYTLIKA